MDLTAIFCQVDDFCKGFGQYGANKLLPCHQYAQNRYRMTLSEIMTIAVYYGVKSEELKTFKSFYEYNYTELKRAFPGLVSYGRLIELREEIILPFIMFLLANMGECTGKSYIDSTPIAACHIKRETSHKVLRKIATKGKSSNGWFYGFKLHLVTNESGEIINLLITSGNIADNNNALMRHFGKSLWGKLFGDKGYIINPTLWDELFRQGLRVIHGIRSNMRNSFTLPEDKISLRKRANICESPFGKLKDRMSLQYTKHRSIYGFLCHILSMIMAFQLWASNRAKKLQAKLSHAKIFASKTAVLTPA
jgi:hypothetical protein